MIIYLKLAFQIIDFKCQKNDNNNNKKIKKSQNHFQLHYTFNCMTNSM